MITIYGIKNCDTMKKAFTWLDKKGIAYQFHDYKIAGAPVDKLSTWFEKLGMWKVINLNSSTWKELPENERNKVKDDTSAIELLKGNTSIIKRPLVELPEGYLLGFKLEEWDKTFSNN